MGDVHYLFTGDYRSEVVTDIFCSNDVVHVLSPSFYNSSTIVITLLCSPKLHNVCKLISDDNNNIYLRGSNV